ncbi:MAG: hypothetical protein NTY69_02760 [Methylococcales bacterium]|nr:hypothetical protein [Methylococcales bacterium]
MDKQSALIKSFEVAQGRNPLEYPFGFFLEDDYDDETAGGSFFWYKTELEMHQAIQNDLIDAFSDGSSDDKDIAKTEIAKLIQSVKVAPVEEDYLITALNDFLTEIQLHLQFIGSFNNLCKGKSDWSRYLREEFREDYLENIDDLTAKKLQSSIKSDDQADFAEFIADYFI